MNIGWLALCVGAALQGQMAGTAGPAPGTYAEFVSKMRELQKTHHLQGIARYESKRFLALGNAGDSFTAQRLRNCEVFHDLFCNHFQRLGFELQSPSEKLMIAVFDSHEGFEAYLDRKMPAGITGIYHPDSNRLVLYDLRGDPSLLASKDQALKKTQKLSVRDRQRFSGTIERQFDDITRDINLSTTMHEAAHLLSFNFGMLNRDGDVACWLAEGLACYCETTDQGDWQSLGSPNPGRIDSLRAAVKQNQTMPLAELVRSDSWLQTRPLLGYGQSWALFRMLLHEQPKAMRTYLALIHPRRTRDHRMTDFLECFGPDVEALDRRYRAHLRQLVDSTPPQKLR